MVIPPAEGAPLSSLRPLDAVLRLSVGALLVAAAIVWRLSASAGRSARRLAAR